MHALDSIRRRFDGFQRGRPWLAFPIAVWRKFSDDGAGRLAEPPGIRSGQQHPQVAGAPELVDVDETRTQRGPRGSFPPFEFFDPRRDRRTVSLHAHRFGIQPSQ